MSETPKPTDESRDLEKLERLHESCRRVREQVRRVIVGQEGVVDLLLATIFSGGHCILEGVPGLAKTLLVKTLSDTLSLSFARIQFTPDLMPSDITGTDVMHEDRGTGAREFQFMRGPIFHSVILADEINRTPPKTQAALLEGMQERQVSAGGKRYPLPRPFFVLATQNPIEQEGTYPLPEAQLDRFLLKIFVDYPDRNEERLIYRQTRGSEPQDVDAVLSGEGILELQETVHLLPVSDLVLDYALSLVRATRAGNPEAPGFVAEWLLYGAGPRGGQGLIAAAKARAALAGRPEVDVEDVRAMAKPVLRHRIVLSYNAEAQGETPGTIIDKLIESVPLHPSTGEQDGRVQQVFRS